REVRFADGTVWSAQDLVDMALAATAESDVIHGSGGADTLVGLGGDDWLIGKGGDDDLSGGPGVDSLEGGLGNDTYRFAPGDGQDVIIDAGGSADVLEFGAGIAPGDIRVRQSSDGSALILLVGTAGERVRIEDALGQGRIETVRFADGTIWGMADLLARAASPLDDFLFGDSGDNTLAGGLGNDRLSGRGGNDTYLFAAGDGQDIIRDDAFSPADRLVISGYGESDIRFFRLGSGTDLLVRFVGSSDQITIVDGLAGNGRAIETIELLADGTVLGVADIAARLIAAGATDGDDTIIGTAGADDIRGGLGNDLLAGGAENDTYRYARGDGDDRIDALGGGHSQILLSGYNPADVVSALRAGPDSLDLVVTFADSGDRLTLIGALGSANGAPGSLVLRFDNGTTWDRTAMRARAIEDVSTDGHDTIQGFDGADLIQLGAGNDFASGGAGADRYVFAPGSGHDRIEDKGTALAEIDVVELAGIASTEVTLGRLYRGSDTVIFGLAGNAADSLTVIDALAGNGLSIEEYRFADGVIWTRANLLALLDNRAPVAGEDGFFSVVTGTDLTLLATDLLRNDFDADDDPLRIVSVDGSPHGSALLDGDGNIRFTANAGFTGPTTIRYTITDDRNGFAVGVINVAVRPVAQARDDDGFTVAEDGFLTIRVERLLSNDIDGDRMIVGQVFGAQGGTVSLASNGDISFTPSANYFGPASFVYAANTPEGGRAEAVVRITVTPVNDAPVAMPDTGFFTDEGRAFTLTAAALLANDLDIDGDALSLVSVQSSA
ncbi:MAG TPA: Ig-like domain-containing protein, partial [Novosphingobium sp.]|nr:Ig-like domain-containing protein [Novosphingobium sp.]